MNKKGFEMTISTIILMVIGVVLLVGLILALNGAFDRFRENTEPIAGSAGFAAVTEACNLACASENTLAYCCQDFEVSGTKLRCDDERVGASCTMSCAAVSCPAIEN